MQTVEGAMLPSNNGKNVENLNGNSSDIINDMESQTNVNHDDGHDLEGETNGVEDKGQWAHTE